MGASEGWERLRHGSEGGMGAREGSERGSKGGSEVTKGLLWCVTERGSQAASRAGPGLECRHRVRVWRRNALRCCHVSAQL